MIIITGSATIRAGSRDQAIKLGNAHSARSRAEPGCLAHDCHSDAANPDRIMFLELWADMAAVQAHFAAPESGQFIREISALASDAPEIRIFDAHELPAPGA
jgi:quinol monooxygenase YgiN